MMRGQAGTTAAPGTPWHKDEGSVVCNPYRCYRGWGGRGGYIQTRSACPLVLLWDTSVLLNLSQVNEAAGRGREQLGPASR